MTGILLLAAAALVIAVLILVFRVRTLVDVMRGDDPNKIGAANKINAVMIPIFFVIFTGFFYWSYQNSKKYFLPDSASVHGVVTDQIFWVIMTILVIAFFVTNILLYLFPYLYQYKEDRRGYYYPDNHKLELVWTLIPALTMSIFVVWGLNEWNKITTFPEEKNCEVVEVMAKQFAWQVRYPGKDNKLGRYQFKNIDATNEFGIDFKDSASMDDFIPREMHIPKGKNVLLKIRARDVIHSVFLPHFRVKMDAVPGMPTKFWFIPTISTAEMRNKTGNPKFNYELACTEICGRGHFAMRFLVVVDEVEDYNKWKDAQNPWSKDNADYVNKLVPNAVAVNAPVVDSVAVTPVVADSVVADTVKKVEVKK